MYNLDINKIVVVVLYMWEIKNEFIIVVIIYFGLVIILRLWVEFILVNVVIKYLILKIKKSFILKIKFVYFLKKENGFNIDRILVI